MSVALTVAFCTYNRAQNLQTLVHALRAQNVSVPFEILAVNNNSTDDTLEILNHLAEEEGIPLRVVTETQQGIVPARNRALEEARSNNYLVFIDDDELPEPGFIAAAVDALENEGADCVGGRIRVCFEPYERPGWLGDEFLPFLAEVDHGDTAFWITDESTPIWTSNIAYRMSLFEDGLCFDSRYDRKGKGSGVAEFSGEDVMMFRTLLRRGVRMRYRPDMCVRHFVEEYRLRRSYFLRRHYKAGVKTGRWSQDEYGRQFCGVPPFMLVNAVRHFARASGMWVRRQPGVLRQAMNGMFELGMIEGRFRRWRDLGDSPQDRQH